MKKITLILFTALLLLAGSGIIFIQFFDNSVMSQSDTISEDEIELVPIVMYHSILKSTKKASIYKLTPKQLEDDLIYLNENGYNTVNVQDLIDFVGKGKVLPTKPIMLTFDDGHYNNYYYALPLLKKYNMKAVIGIVGSFSEESSRTNDINPNYSYLTWTQINELAASGVFEIQNHSYGMHKTNGKRKGASKIAGESPDEYRAKLSADLLHLQEKIFEHTGNHPTAFVYPFGEVCKDSVAIIKDIGFSASLTCREGTNRIIKGDPDCLFLLKRNNRKSNISTTAFFAKLEKFD